MSKQQMMLSALIAVGLLTTGCKTSGTASVDGGIEPLVILRHMEASDHAFRHAAVEVIRSQTDLDHHGSGTLASMDIDFNEQSAVVLALGEQPTAGWSARITGVQHHQRRLRPYVKTIVVQPHRARIGVGDHVETCTHFIRAGHLRHVQPHERHVEHVSRTQ